MLAEAISSPVYKEEGEKGDKPWATEGWGWGIGPQLPPHPTTPLREAWSGVGCPRGLPKLHVPGCCLLQTAWRKGGTGEV